MKKFTIGLFIIGFALTAKAQIGVNTTHPQALFDVDGAGDNPAAGILAVQTENDVVVTTDGKMGVGTIAPTSKLEVNGSATNTIASSQDGVSGIFDFSKSNIIYTSINPGAFKLTNIKQGGTYTLIVTGAIAGTASFTADGFTFRSANNGPTIASKVTLYTFIVTVNEVYYYMATGF